MTLDERLRSASREIDDAVTGRQGVPVAAVAHRRDHAMTVTAITAVCVVTIGTAGWTIGGSPAPGPDVAGSAPTSTAAQNSTTTMIHSTTTAPQDATTATTTSGDGLSQLESIPEEWRKEIANGDIVLLAEDGVVMVAPDFPDDEAIIRPVTRVDDMVARVGLGIPDETSGLSAVWANFVLTADSERVRIFGVAPLGAESVEFRWAGDQRLVIDQVYQRPQAERSAFVGSVDLAVLVDNPPAPIDLVVTYGDGTINEHPDLELVSESIADDYDGTFIDLFRVEQPLVAGEGQATELDVVACHAPEGVTAPPNRSGTGGDLGSFATPVDALRVFVHSDEDPMRPTSGYVEIPQPDGTIAYAVPFEGGDGFVIVVWVAPSGDGWSVNRWEASGC